MTTEQMPTFYSRAFALILIIGLGVICLRMLLPFATALGWAMFFAFLLYPLQQRLAHRLGRWQGHATWLMTVAACVALLAPLAWISTVFVAQATSLVQLLQDHFSNNDLQTLSQQAWLQRGLAWLHSQFNINPVQIEEWATSASRSGLQWLAGVSGQLFIGTLGTAGTLLMTLFLIYFFLRDGQTMVQAVRELVPMRSDVRDELFSHLAAVTRAVVFGTGLTALLQGLLVGLAFAFTGLPSPVVFGVLSVLLALLPAGGTALVWLPAALVLFAQSRWGAGSFMLVWGALLVSMIDNFVKPLLISGRAEVATLTVFLGVLGGVVTFGAIGLFMGPVVLALALALIRFAIQQRQQAVHS